MDGAAGWWTFFDLTVTGFIVILFDLPRSCLPRITCNIEENMRDRIDWDMMRKQSKVRY